MDLLERLEKLRKQEASARPETVRQEAASRPAAPKQPEPPKQQPEQPEATEQQAADMGEERKKETMDLSFLQQIEEIKSKAQQLEEQLGAKESKVQELDKVAQEKRQRAEEADALLAEKQQKAEELDKVLAEKQEEADNVYGGVSQKLTQKFDEQTQDIKESLDSQKELLVQATAKQDEQLSQLDEGMGNLDGQMEQLGQHFERQAVELDGQFKKLAGQLDEIKSKAEADESTATVTAELKPEQLGMMVTAIKDLEEKQTVLEQNLGEKVHAENVKNYRNVQTLFEELEGKIKALEEEKAERPTAKFLVPLLGLWVIGFLAMVFLLLYQAGIFSSFL